MRRIIDHKRIDMTNDEYTLFQKICESYDRPNFQGSELFKNHFETNEHGIIIFVRPPSQQYSSLEVYCFLVSLMVNQHLRISQEQNMSLLKEVTEKTAELINSVREELKLVTEQKEKFEQELKLLKKG